MDDFKEKCVSIDNKVQWLEYELTKDMKPKGVVNMKKLENLVNDIELLAIEVQRMADVAEGHYNEAVANYQELNNLYVDINTPLTTYINSFKDTCGIKKVVPETITTDESVVVDLVDDEQRHEQEEVVAHDNTNNISDNPVHLNILDIESTDSDNDEDYKLTPLPDLSF